MKTRILLFTLLFFLLLTSCEKKNRFVVDANVNRVGVDIIRLDKQIIAIDTANIQAGIYSLAANYPDFFEHYCAIWDMQPTDTAELVQLFSEFLVDTMVVKVNADVLTTFDDISKIETALADGFTYLHHYFPQINIPDIYFFVSGFNRSVFYGRDFIAMGTDLYLGSDYPLYKDLTYNYLTYNMNPESIPVDVLLSIFTNSFRMRSEQNRLLENILYQGKMFYLLSVFLPDMDKTALIGYTKEKWDWCEKYERDIWGTMIDKKDLFSTEPKTIRGYTGDAPFTSAISQDSPGRLGTWIGWQIIESYMNRNQEVTLEDLMNENDYQRILELSAYRP